MCGRYALNIPPHILAEWYDLMNRFIWKRRFNIAPSQDVPVIRRTDDGQCEGVLMRWGLIPHWAKDSNIGSRMINARSETAADKPSFREAMKHRRCLVPASGFYEWKTIGTRKMPYYICPKDDDPLSFAGLWESWTDQNTGEHLETCTILTIDANELLAPLHPRMPVILERELWNAWLNTDEHVPDEVTPLLKPAPSDRLQVHPVSRRVNNVRNDDPSLVNPVDLDEGENGLFNS